MEAELDESKLAAENGEIHLLQWLSTAEKSLAGLSTDTLKSVQPATEATLLKCITAPPPFQIPGRPIRVLVARCLLAIYARGETVLYTISFRRVSRLLETPSPQSGTRDCETIVYQLMSLTPDQLMSFMMEITLIAIRTVKSSSNSILLRTHALRAVSLSVSTAGKAITENTIKDLVKQLRVTLADKSMALQRSAAETLLAVHTHLGLLRTPQEIEQIVTTCVRAFDTADKPTRRVLSRLIGHLLASTQTPISRPAETSKKNTTNGTNRAAMRKTRFRLLPPRPHTQKSFPPSRCSLF
ncbi:hypothetical protein BDV93DRAFT_566321 [Ceratobasidium sp. AG-I]|nr:hypothetical protein BDV93DRAFT_566321 [Ceratobasidium sp. AG-I]